MPDTPPLPPLTPRQARFVEEWFVDFDASAAALRAGYRSKNSGPQRGAAVRAAMAKRWAERAETLGLSGPVTGGPDAHPWAPGSSEQGLGGGPGAGGGPLLGPAPDFAAPCLDPARRPLRAREARFVEEWFVDFNASAAARRAGYARPQHGLRLRRRPAVQAAMERRWAELSARAELEGENPPRSIAAPPVAAVEGRPPDFARVKDDPARPLTPRQQRFVQEYMLDLNAAAAARRAGYTGRHSRSVGSMLRNKPRIAAAISARLARRAAAFDIEAEQVVVELSKIGFANAQGAVGDDGRILRLDEMAPEMAAAMRGEVRYDRNGAPAGLVVRQQDKTRALGDLARHLDLLEKKAVGVRARGGAKDDGGPASAGMGGRERPDWAPLPGPQSMAFTSAADVIGFGGAAGGGKTDLAIGLALTRHRRSAIFRREATQLSSILDRMAELCGGRGGYAAGERVWRAFGRRIEFGSCPHPGDEARHQGREKDLLVLDEAQNFLESQARFLMGWVRSAIPGQKCTTLMTFNPPTHAEGRWVTAYFAPWLDPAHPNPAQPGELRWFAMVDGEEVEVAGPEPFVMGPDGERVVATTSKPLIPAFAGMSGGFDGKALIHPTSRTFIPSRLSDNPHLASGGYRARLQAMPEPLRTQMLEGDFSAGVEDDPWQVIPTAWVDEAMRRWEPGCIKPMDAMGVDVARGGRDKTIIARRHGVWLDELLVLDGPSTPDGPSLAGQVMARRSDYAVVHIDVVGWGSSPYDVLKSNGVHVEAVNGAEKARGRTGEAGLELANRRAELWWRMREALDPKGDAPIALPPDPALKADLTAPRWKMTPGGVQIEAKAQVAARIGRSPDRGDAACLCLIATPKRPPAPVRRPGLGRPVSWMG